jgi:hypothetical protein
MVELEIPNAMVAFRTVAPRPDGSLLAPPMRKAWLVAPLCGGAAILAGLALGYVLSGRPDIASIPSKMTGITHGSMQLRIDYELRKSSLCPDQSLHCRRIRVVYR